MPPAKKRKKNPNAKPGIAREYLNKTFSTVPNGNDVLNGHVLYLYLLNDSSVGRTDRAVKEIFSEGRASSIPVLTGKISSLVKRTLLKYKKLTNASEFDKFKDGCNEPFSTAINGMEDILMYDIALLTGFDFNGRSKVTFNPPVSPSNPGDSLVLRPLSTADFDRGFIQLLSELTGVGEITQEKYLERFNDMKRSKSYYVTVVENTDTNQVVAAATLVLEQKFIHECALRGRIEEVVVNSDYRGKQLGKLLMSSLTLLSQDLGCYKTTLECAEGNIPFYEKFGYVKDKEVYMQNRH